MREYAASRCTKTFLCIHLSMDFNVFLHVTFIVIKYDVVMSVCPSTVWRARAVVLHLWSEFNRDPSAISDSTEMAELLRLKNYVAIRQTNEHNIIRPKFWSIRRQTTNVLLALFNELYYIVYYVS